MHELLGVAGCMEFMQLDKPVYECLCWEFLSSLNRIGTPPTKTSLYISNFDFSIDYLRPTLWSLTVECTFPKGGFRLLAMRTLMFKSSSVKKLMTTVPRSLTIIGVMLLTAQMAPKPLQFATPRFGTFIGSSPTPSSLGMIAKPSLFK